MQKLFLSSYFKDVAELFPGFVNEPLPGKKITFIPTASKPERFTFYIDEDKKALQDIGLAIDELDVSTAPQQQITSKLTQNPYIFVSGGNTFYLLQELKRTGADKLLVELIKKGKPYIGSSAGSIILSPSIDFIQTMDDARAAPLLDNYCALGMVDFYILPHATNFPFKRAAKAIIKQYGNDINLKPISNNQVIAVSGDKISVLSN